MSFAHSQTHENHPYAPPCQGGVGEVADGREFSKEEAAEEETEGRRDGDD